MSDTLRPARLDWSQGLPFASDFGDIYFSRADGLAEARHVFLGHNALPDRLAAVGAGNGFTIVETGFGTGLNFLATVDLWRRAGGAGWLHYASVEKFPLSAADLVRAHACWPELAAPAGALQRRYPALVPGFHRLCLPDWRVTLTLFFGDIADFLPRLSARADAWFLDGFAPARNPGMWNETVYDGMARLSAECTTVATFTAAGAVRRGLVAAGFDMEKVPGHGRKRDMLRGRFKRATAVTQFDRPWLARPSMPARTREACVIGAGIAGAHTAHRLALHGWRVTVLESGHVAGGGSGNPAAVVYGRLAGPGKAADHFSQQAWLFALQELAQLPDADSPWHPCGILQLAAGNQSALVHALAGQPFPADVVRPVSAAEASELAALPLELPGLFYPHAGWLEARRYCRQLLAHPAITLHEGVAAASLERKGEQWRLLDDAGATLAEAPVVIVATAAAATSLAALSDLPLATIRGQVSLAPAVPATASLRTVVCHDGYVSPALPGQGHCLGATFQPGDHDTALRPQDHAENRALLAAAMPAFAAALPPEQKWKGRAALRCQSPDYLPLVGPVAAREDFLQAYAGLRDGKVMAYPELPVLPGLYVNVAHGSKGFSQAALAAEILAAELEGGPAPVSRAVLDALHPMRFRARELRRARPASQR